MNVVGVISMHLYWIFLRFWKFPETAWWPWRSTRRLMCVVGNFWISARNRLAARTGRRARQHESPSLWVLRMKCLAVMNTRQTTQAKLARVGVFMYYGWFWSGKNDS